MIELFLSTENLPFSIALTMMIGIGLLEGISAVIGFGFSQILENLLPEIDAPTVDLPDVYIDPDVVLDSGADLRTPSLLTRFIGWIKIREVPILVVLVVFLTIFSLSGFVIQSVARQLMTVFLPWYIAVLPAFVITLPMVRGCSLLLSKCVIKDETTAVSTSSFIGKIATITLGTARKGLPAQAKLKDKYGQVHYVMVEPDDDNAFEQSSEVLLVKKDGSVFKAIRNPNNKLTD
ncbi:MAG: YqiJ family protein [Chitinispirillaceae bacterium]